VNLINHLRRSIFVAAVATTVVVGVAGPAQAGIAPKVTTGAHAPTPAGALVAAVTKPMAPRSPTAKPGNTAVKLTWLAPSSNGGATVNRYRVQRATSTTGPWKTIAKPTVRRYRAAGLTNGKRYYFRVAAHNAAGWSTPSKVVSAVPRTTPTAPRSPKATPANKIVKLTWLRPSSNGGASVDKYQVQRWNGSQWVRVAFPAGLSYQVSNLVNGTKYSFRIRAHNSVGWSPFTRTVSAVPRTVPNAPTPPTVTPGDGSVTLNWQPPAGNGAAVDYYQVQRAVSPGSWTTFPAQKPAEFIDTNVINGGSYYYHVRAHNAAGYGPFSTVVIGVPRTVPSAPASCSASGFEVTKKWVSFGWDAPASNGGAPVTGYVTQVFRNGIYQGTQGSSPTPPYHDVFEVQYSGNYDVNIYPMNKAGWGPACHATTTVPVP
jgi:Fibronectin type III domain